MQRTDRGRIEKIAAAVGVKNMEIIKISKPSMRKFGLEIFVFHTVENCKKSVGLRSYDSFSEIFVDAIFCDVRKVLAEGF